MAIYFRQQHYEIMSSNVFQFQFSWLGIGSETIAVSTFPVLAPGKRECMPPDAAS
jgi:hypothetical protein